MAANQVTRRRWDRIGSRMARLMTGEKSPEEAVYGQLEGYVRDQTLLCHMLCALATKAEIRYLLALLVPDMDFSIPGSAPFAFHGGSTYPKTRLRNNRWRSAAWRESLL